MHTHLLHTHSWKHVHTSTHTLACTCVCVCVCTQVSDVPYASGGPSPFPSSHGAGQGAPGRAAGHPYALPTRPASAYARLKGPGAGSPPLHTTHFPSYGEPAHAWEFAAPPFTPAVAPPLPLKVSAAYAHVALAASATLHGLCMRAVGACPCICAPVCVSMSPIH